tara:strand:- start:2747 stop:9130 length:6384 start_codon:yes stop_codon:yes gene_type:complete
MPVNKGKGKRFVRAPSMQPLAPGKLSVEEQTLRFRTGPAAQLIDVAKRSRAKKAHINIGADSVAIPRGYNATYTESLGGAFNPQKKGDTGLVGSDAKEASSAVDGTALQGEAYSESSFMGAAMKFVNMMAADAQADLANTLAIAGAGLASGFIFGGAEQGESVGVDYGDSGGYSIYYSPSPAKAKTQTNYGLPPSPGSTLNSSTLMLPTSDDVATGDGVSPYKPEIIASFDLDPFMPSGAAHIIQDHNRAHAAKVSQELFHFRLQENVLLYDSALGMFKDFWRSLPSEGNTTIVTGLDITINKASEYGNAPETLRIDKSPGAGGDGTPASRMDFDVANFVEACRKFYAECANLENNFYIHNLRGDVINDFMTNNAPGTFTYGSKIHKTGWFGNYNIPEFMDVCLAINNNTSDLSASRIIMQLLVDLRATLKFHSPNLFDSAIWGWSEWRSPAAQANQLLGGNPQNPMWQANLRNNPADIYTFDRTQFGWATTASTWNVSSFSGYTHFVNSLPTQAESFGRQGMNSNRVKLLCVILGREFTNSASMAAMNQASSDSDDLKSTKGFYNVLKPHLFSSGDSTYYPGEDFIDRLIGVPSELGRNIAIEPALHGPAVSISTASDFTGGSGGAHDSDGVVRLTTHDSTWQQLGSSKLEPKNVPPLHRLLSLKNRAGQPAISEILGNDADLVLPLEMRATVSESTHMRTSPGWDLFFRNLWTPGDVDTLGEQHDGRGLFANRAFADYCQLWGYSSLYLHRAALNWSDSLIWNHSTVAGNEEGTFHRLTPDGVYQRILKGIMNFVAPIARSSGGGIDLEYGNDLKVDEDWFSKDWDAGSVTPGTSYAHKDLSHGNIGLTVLMKLIEHDTTSPERASLMRWRLYQLFLTYRDARLNNEKPDKAGHDDLYQGIADPAGDGTTFMRHYRPTACATNAWIQEGFDVTQGIEGIPFGARISQILMGDFEWLDNAHTAGLPIEGYGVGGNSDNLVQDGVTDGEQEILLAGTVEGNYQIREQLIEILASYAQSRLFPMSFDNAYMQGGLADYTSIDSSYQKVAIETSNNGHISDQTDAINPGAGTSQVSFMYDVDLPAPAFDLFSGTDHQSKQYFKKFFKELLRTAVSTSNYEKPDNIVVNPDTGETLHATDLFHHEWETGGKIPHCNLFEEIFEVVDDLCRNAAMRAGRDGGDMTGIDEDALHPKTNWVSHSYITTDDGEPHLAPDYEIIWKAHSTGGLAGGIVEDWVVKDTDAGGNGPSSGGDTNVDSITPGEDTVSQPNLGSGRVIVKPRLSRWSGFDDNTICAMVFEAFWSLITTNVSSTVAQVDPQIDSAQDGTLIKRRLRVNPEANRQLVVYLGVLWKSLKNRGRGRFDALWPGMFGAQDQEFSIDLSEISAKGDSNVGTHAGSLSLYQTFLTQGDASLGPVDSPVNTVIRSLNVGSYVGTQQKVATAVVLQRIVSQNAVTHNWILLDDVKYKLSEEEYIIRYICSALESYGKSWGAEPAKHVPSVYKEMFNDFMAVAADHDNTSGMDKAFVGGIDSDAVHLNNFSHGGVPLAFSLYGMEWEQINCKRFQRVRSIAGAPNTGTYKPFKAPYLDVPSAAFDTLGPKRTAATITSLLTSTGTPAWCKLALPWGSNVRNMVFGIPRGMIERLRRAPINSDRVGKIPGLSNRRVSRSTILRIRVFRRDLRQPGLIFYPLTFDFDMNMFVDHDLDNTQLDELISGTTGVPSWQEILKKTIFTRFPDAHSPMARNSDNNKSFEDSATRSSGAGVVSGLEAEGWTQGGMGIPWQPEDNPYKNFPGYTRFNSIQKVRAGGDPSQFNKSYQEGAPLTRLLHNHLVDYTLKKYYSILTGMQFDELAFPNAKMSWVNNSLISGAVAQYVQALIDGDEFGGMLIPLGDAQASLASGRRQYLANLFRVVAGCGGSGELPPEFFKGLLDANGYQVTNRVGIAGYGISEFPQSNEMIKSEYNENQSLDNPTFQANWSRMINHRLCGILLNTWFTAPERLGWQIKATKKFDRTFMVPIDIDQFSVDINASNAGDPNFCEELKQQGYLIGYKVTGGGLIEDGPEVWKVNRTGGPPPDPDNINVPFFTGDASMTDVVNDNVLLDQFFFDCELVDDEGASNITVGDPTEPSHSMH